MNLQEFLFSISPNAKLATKFEHFCCNPVGIKSLKRKIEKEDNIQLLVY